MQLCKLPDAGGRPCVGVVRGDAIAILPPHAGPLERLLATSDPLDTATRWLHSSQEWVPRVGAPLLAPIDRQEVWGAGVTYQRSQKARMDESVDAATFYDKVYTAARPELFFKAAPHRVVGPGGSVRIRRDTRWTVPEPELTLVLDSELRIVGYTIGNDMSARDIEGENPLYLPQAKVYNQCAALGPVITLPPVMPPPEQTEISMAIRRAGATAFAGQTSLARMRRKFDDLVSWLGRDNSFPNGVFLMTGTGVVPPNDFALQNGDEIEISITGIGVLTNTVVQDQS